jgi:hypothetical protein
VRAGDPLALLAGNLHPRTSAHALSFRWFVDGDPARSAGNVATVLGPAPTSDALSARVAATAARFHANHSVYNAHHGQWSCNVSNIFGSTTSEALSVTILENAPTWYNLSGVHGTVRKLVQGKTVLLIEFDSAQPNGYPVQGYKLLQYEHNQNGTVSASSSRRRLTNFVWVPAQAEESPAASLRRLGVVQETIPEFVPGIRRKTQIELIKDLSGDSVFEFRVVPVNALGAGSESAPLLNIRASPQPPQFKVQPAAPGEVYPASTLILNVTVIGTPKPTLQWRRNLVPISASAEGRVQGANTQELTILNVSEGDDALFDVVASNLDVNDERVYAASVGVPLVSLKPPKAAQCAKLPNTAELGAGAFLTLSCEETSKPYLSNPASQYRWWFSSAGGAFVAVGGGAESYMLANVTLLHQGLFKCEAFNQIGAANSSEVPVAISACSPGFRRDALGFCHSCEAGTYQSGESKNRDCVSCPAGQYEPNSQAVTCRDCERGQFTANTGRAACSLCPRGKYGSNLGSTGCSRCEVGKYSGAQGESQCHACSAVVAGSTTFAAVGQAGDFISEAACACDKLQFRCPLAVCKPSSAVSASATAQCSKCVVGMVCSESGQTLEDVTVAKGYFKIGNFSTEVVRCLGSGDCVGGSTGGQCRNYTTGLLCHRCKAGYKRSGGVCKACPPPSVPTTTVMSGVGPVLSIALIVLVAAGMNHACKRLSMKLARAMLLVGAAAGAATVADAAANVASISALATEKAEKVSSDVEGGSTGAEPAADEGEALPPAVPRGPFTQIATWLQCLSSFVVTLEVPWPPQFKGFLRSLFGVFNFDLVSIFAGSMCDVDGGFTSAFYVHMFLPLFVLGVLGVASAIIHHGLFARICPSSAQKEPATAEGDGSSVEQALQRAKQLAVERMHTEHMQVLRREQSIRTAAADEDMQAQARRALIIQTMGLIAFLMYVTDGH